MSQRALEKQPAIQRRRLSFLRAPGDLSPLPMCAIVRRMRLLAVCVAVLGCATAHPPEGAAPQGATPSEDPSAYFPLMPGWKWAYHVEKGGDSLLATYAVVERVAGDATVQGGDERLIYTVLPDGIARREGTSLGDYLLKRPVRAGTTWPLAQGEAKVVAVGRTVTVPAGPFRSCATVEETRTDPARVVRTVYAAGAGPIMLEVQVHDPATGQFVTDTRASLVGLTRPGEDPLGPSEGVAVPGGPPAPRP